MKEFLVTVKLPTSRLKAHDSQEALRKALLQLGIDEVDIVSAVVRPVEP